MKYKEIKAHWKWPIIWKRGSSTLKFVGRQSNTNIAVERARTEKRRIKASSPFWLPLSTNGAVPRMPPRTRLHEQQGGAHHGGGVGAGRAGRQVPQGGCPYHRPDPRRRVARSHRGRRKSWRRCEFQFPLSLDVSAPPISDFGVTLAACWLIWLKCGLSVRKAACLLNRNKKC